MFSYVNDAVFMLIIISRNLHKKSSEVENQVTFNLARQLSRRL